MAKLYFKYGTRKPNAKPITYELGGTNGDCWECTSHVIDNGYPRIRVDDKLLKLSRWAYEVFYQVKIKEGMHMLHNRDNPKCINPEHLREGTDQDNANDKVSRNRAASVKGESHGKSKLTIEDVITIKDSNLTAKELASIYGVHIQSIYDIRKGKTWGWLDG